MHLAIHTNMVTSGTFAAVNGVVSALAVLFGHRLVVKKITCGHLGKKNSRSWTFMWILPVALQLAANAFIAFLIKKTAGYKADFKISEIMLFLVARPRLSWIILGIFAFRSRTTKLASSHRRGEKSPYGSSTRLHGSYADIPLDDVDSEGSLGSRGGKSSHRDFPWWSAFMSQFIGEFILQIITLYIMGRTAHFATIHGYYKIYHKSYWQIPAAARMMYSGALYYLVAGSLFLIAALAFILDTIFGHRVKELGKASTGGVVATLVFLLISTWMGSWIFWAGFVKLAGDLYCPPKLIHQGIIWSFFSAVGIILGAGV